MAKWDYNYLQRASAQDVRSIMRDCHDLRSVYRNHRRGYSNDRCRTMRHIAEIPISFYFDKEYSKYFDSSASPKDRQKDLDKFLQKFPQ